MPGNVDISSPEFRKRLQSLRRQRSLSRREVADAIGISSRAYTNWETGRQKSAMEHNVLRLAEFLDVDFETLVNGTTPDGESPPTPAGPPRRSRRPIIIALAAVVGVLLLGFGILQRARGRHIVAEVNGNRIVVRDAIVGWPLWSDRFDSNVSLMRVMHWRNADVVVAGLNGAYPDTGRLMVRRGRDGKILWEDRPDLAEAQRVFGPLGGETVGFSASRIETGDIDGDGVAEIIVQYTHRRWFPSYIRIYRRDGTVVGTYYNGGHFYDLLVTDIDHDGRDEILASGTNNGKSYQGATIILLDDAHCNGASRDPLMMADCPLPDSSAVRVVFPQWDDRFMTDCGSHPGSGRLTARNIDVHFAPGGSARITVDVGIGQCIAIMALDGRLRPMRVDLSDSMVASMSAWPEGDRQAFTGGLDAWMKRYYRYGSAADE